MQAEPVIRINRIHTTATASKTVARIQRKRMMRKFARSRTEFVLRRTGEEIAEDTLIIRHQLSIRQRLCLTVLLFKSSRHADLRMHPVRSAVKRWAAGFFRTSTSFTRLSISTFTMRLRLILSAATDTTELNPTQRVSRLPILSRMSRVRPTRSAKRRTKTGSVSETNVSHPILTAITSAAVTITSASTTSVSETTGTGQVRLLSGKTLPMQDMSGL